MNLNLLNELMMQVTNEYNQTRDQKIQSELTIGFLIYMSSTIS